MKRYCMFFFPFSSPVYIALSSAYRNRNIIAEFEGEEEHGKEIIMRVEHPIAKKKDKIFHM